MFRSILQPLSMPIKRYLEILAIIRSIRMYFQHMRNSDTVTHFKLKTTQRLNITKRLCRCIKV